MLIRALEKTIIQCWLRCQFHCVSPEKKTVVKRLSSSLIAVEDSPSVYNTLQEHSAKAHEPAKEKERQPIMMIMSTVMWMAVHRLLSITNNRI